MSNDEAVELSVVVPVYSCRETLPVLAEKLRQVLETLVSSYELVLVNDDCPESSWDVIVRLSEEYPFVRGIKLSRNFGQHEAITAGLHDARGDWIVVMDCDLQDRPEEITPLYRRAMQGFDIVYARRCERKDSWLKVMSSRMFYRLLGYLTDTKLDPTIGNYGIYSRKVIEAVLSMKEMLRYFPVMVRWVGFKSSVIDVEHSERASGKTAYSLGKLVRMALGVMVSFSDKPLRIIVQMGFWMSLMSALSAVLIVAQAIRGDVEVQGWASVMVTLWFIGGLVMMMMGVVGVYIGKAFDEVKRRPTYIIDQRTRDR